MLLKEAGHSIKGVFSSDDPLRMWAATEDVFHGSPDLNLDSDLKRLSFDFLFSIANPRILSEKTLSSSSRGAINFHDGPLPRYAGSNATSWALINQELEHAVTWHEMAEKVDAGRILLQERVYISPRDTAMTLNAKCYDAAIRSFRELIVRLCDNSLEPTKQDSNLRSFYPSAKRPSGAGLIDWAKPAEELDALTRALDYGTYSNPLCLPKIFTGDTVLLVGDLAIEGFASPVDPGMITNISGDAIQISTCSKDVSLRKLKTMNGRSVSTARLVSEFDWQVGVQLPTLDDEVLRGIRLLTEEISEHESFWLSRLQSTIPSRVPIWTSEYASGSSSEFLNYLEVDFPESAVDFQLERENGLPMLMIASFLSLLHRLGSGNGIVVGWSDSALEQELGVLKSMFASQLPLQDAMPPDETTTERVHRLTSTLALLREKKTYPRDLMSRSPSLNHMHGQYPVGIVLGTEKDPSEIPDTDLILQIEAESPKARLYYRTSVIGNADIERFKGQFELLMEMMAREPNSRIAELSILSDKERTQLLIGWNETNREYPSDTCLHILFEDRVDQTPDATALVCEDSQMTYRELDSRSNQLAHYLREIGIDRGSLVAVSLERTTDLVVGLLGVLKAGAAYVPLDPSYPEERLRFMIEDSKAPVILTQDRICDRFSLSKAHVIPLDTQWQDIQNQPTGRVANNAMPDHLAYVIYTSGSTGTPKGAMNTHLGVCNQLLWLQEMFSITERDVVLHKTPCGFDVSVIELFLPIVSGASLVLARPGGHLDTEYLGRLISAEEVTIACFVPATLRALLNEVPTSRLKSLRHITTGGDALTIELLDQFFDRKESEELSVELHNCYGATEVSVTVAHWLCRRGGIDGRISIGSAAANTRFYVLDSTGNPTPTGVPGELYVGGVQVGKGYWRQEDLTNERFVGNPFRSHSDEKLYRTGDRVRFLKDGFLEFLGRYDEQIQIGGLRIEPGEIEATLESYEEVDQAVVILKKSAADDARLVAYVTGNSAHLTSRSLRKFLQSRLPDHMVPGSYVILDSFPLLPSEKIDITALPEPSSVRDDFDNSYSAPQSERERQIASILSKLIGIDRVGREDNFFDIGATSFLLLQAAEELRHTLPDAEISVVDLFQYPSVRSLASHIGRDQSLQILTQEKVKAPSFGSAHSGAIAIVGFAGRFPGAEDVASYWSMIENGLEGISHYGKEELIAEGILEDELEDPDFIRAGAVTDGYDLFDASFFGYTPREASILDPQQRLFLESAWHALEDAAYDPIRYDGRIGIFAGMGHTIYLRENLLSNPELISLMGEWQTSISNEADFLASRVAYKLGLSGPAVNIQTACSTSLVAVHLARQSLLTGDSDIALAGGVTLIIKKAGYRYQTGAIHSPDGHCRPFDASANGTVPGSGVGIVVLKRLEDAVHDRDHIRSVIIGSAINNDGSLKVGFTAPSVQRQSEVISQALRIANVNARSIGLVEAHGTGTTLGDPIEIKALTQAFRASTKDKQYCAIGSVKGNIGHADTASGVAGLIKATLAIENQKIPPSLHFEMPNPEIDFENSPFFVSDSLIPWPAEKGDPRRASVSSFGVGGTNAHVVLEEAPKRSETDLENDFHLFVLSAKTQSALVRRKKDLSLYLTDHETVSLSDVTYTLQTGRTEFEHRTSCVCATREEAIETLQESDPNREVSMDGSNQVRPVVFMFSGQGAQYVNMGRELYEDAPIFREEMDRCFDFLDQDSSVNLRERLFPDLDEEENQASNFLNQTAMAQPALFSISYALARQWQAWGIQPAAMIGHSLGEYVAACVSGVLQLEDALRLVSKRGLLMQSCSPGDMLAVFLPEKEARPLIGQDLSIAVINAPALIVVSGPSASIKSLSEKLDRNDVKSRLLHTSHAFHSELMEPILASFEASINKDVLRSPKIPYVSNTTGTWITSDETRNPGYWARHLREAVRFADGIETLGSLGNPIFLEVGPGNLLGNIVKQNSADLQRAYILQSLGNSKDSSSDYQIMLKSLGRLWSYGQKVNWGAVFQDQNRNKLSLPGYPFERRRHWIEPAKGDRVADGFSWSELIEDQKSPTIGEKVETANRTSKIRYVEHEQSHKYKSDLENRIATIWKELMGLSHIGRDDNFFELGGHSLLAIQMQSQIKEQLGAEVSLIDLFDSPTIRGIARAIERSSGREGDKRRSRIKNLISRL
ncbi:MAG: amino acid adenylation domain-containing protein [Bacteroidetes bacterium]|nr:amino acid adenylation domain-containing protein [Bacteroidota bacterium]